MKLSAIQTTLVIVLASLLTACASTRSPEFTNYHQQLVAPEVVEEYALVNKKVFEEPSLGAMLRYQNRDYLADNISLYVYPIFATDWENQHDVINKELAKALGNIDAAVQYGYYQARSEAVVTEHVFEESGVKYFGKKASLELVSNEGYRYFSDVYLFIAQDKFIKFRTSFDSRTTQTSMGDNVVSALLPKLQVPPESLYMKKLRAAHQQRVQQNVRRLLAQATEQQS